MLRPFCRERFPPCEIFVKDCLPCISPERLDNGESFCADLVAGFRVVDGSIWLIGIVKSDARFNELMYSLPSESLTGVRGIFTTVMLAAILHDGRNPHERFFYRIPRAAWLEIEKG